MIKTRYVLCFLLLAIGQTSAQGEGGSFSTNRGWLSITSDSGGTKLAEVAVYGNIRRSANANWIETSAGPNAFVAALAVVSMYS